jgi:hypothetical protein
VESSLIADAPHPTPMASIGPAPPWFSIRRSSPLANGNRVLFMFMPSGHGIRLMNFSITVRTEKHIVNFTENHRTSPTDGTLMPLAARHRHRPRSYPTRVDTNDRNPKEDVSDKHGLEKTHRSNDRASPPALDLLLCSSGNEPPSPEKGGEESPPPVALTRTPYGRKQVIS